MDTILLLFNGLILIGLGVGLIYIFKLKGQFNSQFDLNTQDQKNKNQQLELNQFLSKFLSNSLSQLRIELFSQISQALTDQNKQNINQIELLKNTVYTQLKDIGGLVEKRLESGFEKTQKTFESIIKRLAMIDQAQQKITELSNNVVSLQSLLSDKRSRGAFGEIQLNQLLENTLPKKYYELQYTLSNTKRADCLLKLPGKMGNMVVDSKFPLESYQIMMDLNTAQSDKILAEQQFKKDIKKHILDIAEKYIITGETADSAILFIPAEAIFAEIHGHHPDLVNLSHQKKVWLTSPSTMMAILTTVSAVIKDEQTKEQMHVIQTHLIALSKDFGRFQKRMDGLQRHIDQAQEDVQSVNISAKKISSRFEKIESVKLEGSEVQGIE